MRLAAYVMLLFAISLVFYLLGYTSIMSFVYEQQSKTLGGHGFDFLAFLQLLTKTMLSEDGLRILIGISIAGLISSLLGGFSAQYIVPTLMLLAFMNIFVFPLSFVFDQGIPDVVAVPLTVFFNIITALAILSFVRGGV